MTESLPGYYSIARILRIPSVFHDLRKILRISSSIFQDKFKDIFKEKFKDNFKDNFKINFEGHHEGQLEFNLSTTSRTKSIQH